MVSNSLMANTTMVVNSTVSVFIVGCLVGRLSRSAAIQRCSHFDGQDESDGLSKLAIVSVSLGIIGSFYRNVY